MRIYLKLYNHKLNFYYEKSLPLNFLGFSKKSTQNISLIPFNSSSKSKFETDNNLSNGCILFFNLIVKYLDLIFNTVIFLQWPLTFCSYKKLAIFTTNVHTKNECLINHKTVIRSTEPPIFCRCCYKLPFLSFSPFAF